MDVDYSCYEGREVRGASQVVLSRGSVISRARARDGEFTGRKGHGRFVKRGTADFARIRADRERAAPDQEPAERTCPARDGTRR